MRYFRKNQFLYWKWARKGAWGRGWVFFKNPGHFWVFMMNKRHATCKKKTNELFLRNQRKGLMDERKNERTDGQDWNYRTLLLKGGSNELKSEPGDEVDFFQNFGSVAKLTLLMSNFPLLGYILWVTFVIFPILFINEQTMVRLRVRLACCFFKWPLLDPCFSRKVL